MLFFSSLLRIWFFHILFVFLSVTCFADLAEETVYLTWQRNPCTTMTIQWITLSNQKESKVIYRLNRPGSTAHEIKGETLFLNSRYLVHRIELNHLQPNSDYLFKVLPHETEYQFRTAPASLSGKELRFVVGGDMYHDDMKFMAQTSRAAALTNPAFALIGGDIAYAVGSPRDKSQNIDRWIDWIKSWHSNMVSPDKNLIPVIAAIGNHDLIGHFNQSPAQAATFLALFPKSSGNTYDVIDFDSYLSIFILDSDHANSISGKQKEWLNDNLIIRQNTLHKFAVYHVPAHPSIRKKTNPHSTAIRKHWVPLFEKWGIQTAFEHHDHAYKRTHPLLRDRIQPKGIVYLGDGAWGVEKPRHPKMRRKRPIIAKFSASRHFIAVTLSPNLQRFMAIDDKGQIIDNYSKSINNTKPEK